MDNIYLGTHTGEILSLDYVTHRSDVIFEAMNDNEYISGIKKYKDSLYILSPYVLYEANLNTNRIENYCSTDKFPLFTSFEIKDDIIYIVSGKNSALYLLGLNFSRKDKDIEFPAFKMNDETEYFAFANDVFIGDKIHLNFGPIESYKNTFSGVAILDKDLNTLEKINYGWNSVRSKIIDNKRWSLCNRLNNEYIGCLLIDNTITIKFDSNFELYDFDVSENKICISGHYRKLNNGTFSSCGFLMLFDRKFNKIGYFSFNDTGAITCCRII